MKYRLLFLSLLLCPALLWGELRQKLSAAQPKYLKLLPGSAKLSNGIYWNHKPESIAEKSLAAFFAERSIPVNGGQPTSRNVRLDVLQVSAIPQISEDERHGYSIEISPLRITIRYTTPMSESRAFRQLMGMIREQNTGRKKSILSCCEIRDWVSGETLSVFRWNGPESVIPANAGMANMMLTDPVKGWIGAHQVLQAVGYDMPLYTDDPLTYADIEKEREGLIANGIDVVPTFDLTGSNERFEEVTGHPMLSVEGMRFVQLLLDTYFASTGTETVAFIVPFGRYRDQLSEFVARYPQITNPLFSDK